MRRIACHAKQGARGRRSSGLCGRLTVVLSSLLLGLPSAGCRSGRVPDDELVMLIESAPLAIDPRFAVNAYDYKLAQLVYAPLVSVDEHLEPLMVLAESVVRESPTAYLVTLREARFSDGRPVTTDDVLYTIESTRERATNHLKLRFREDGIIAMEPLDARRIRFRLSHPHAPFVTDLDEGILARPPPGHELDVPLGAGAFVLESSDRDRWRFRPNPFHFRGAPSAKRLTVKVIRDDNSRLLALVGGSADLTQNTVSPLLLDAVAKQNRLRVETGPSSIYTYLGVNCDDPILRDVRVRKAIAYAIDREKIIRTKFGGRAVLASGFLPPFHWAYAADTEKYPYDPQKSRALLDEAGLKDPDGNGPRPRLTLVYKTSSNHFRIAIAQVIAAQLAEVGIEVELRPLEFATFFADVKAGNYQIFSMQIPEISEPDIYTNFYHSSRVPTRENPDRGGNRMRYRNPALDALLEQGATDVDRPDRIRDYGEVQRILARDLPTISLWHEDNVAVMNERVTGFRVLPTAYFTSLAQTRKSPRDQK